MTEIFRMRFGSHVYGTNLPTSDNDYKGIFIPETRDIILGKGKETLSTSTKTEDRVKNDSSDIDIEVFSLKKYMKLLLEGQTVALTMLFCPKEHCILSTPISREIVLYKDKWLHKGVSAFAGYCRQQANKYGIKGSRVAATRDLLDTLNLCLTWWQPTDKISEIWLHLEKLYTGKEHFEFSVVNNEGSKPVRMLSCCNRKMQEHITFKEAIKIYQHVFDEYGARALQAENNENIDWKACMHAIRVAGEAKELLLNHNITYPRPNASVLLLVRKGELPYKQVADMIEQGLIDMEQAVEKSTLPEKPDYNFAEDFIFESYMDGIIAERWC